MDAALNAHKGTNLLAMALPPVPEVPPPELPTTFPEIACPPEAIFSKDTFINGQPCPPGPIQGRPQDAEPVKSRPATSKTKPIKSRPVTIKTEPVKSWPDAPGAKPIKSRPATYTLNAVTQPTDSRPDSERPSEWRYLAAAS